MKQRKHFYVPRPSQYQQHHYDFVTKKVGEGKVDFEWFQED